ncbi:type II toxin-antitoxin system RnlB family antitoxin [Mucilaginibacter sp. E4BP6]|uniref:type II toxin-antitoxin system RnlB family antitoxin n=1 Tax=Mucilaginibacter sp. E4BP6 TaxID=2723089 RepID=UPI0015CE9086|nr:type II toxin-antitoxin system RnlB family antitoxin [Mucilaginibacter sp. E4BP6]NYE65720.1 hypothetical protein [Mucilaginibacter sp. E4BP6]
MNIQKPYSIKKINRFFYFVIGNDSTRFDCLLPFVNEELKAKKFQGQIVFDLLLSNGNTNRRYFQSIFNGEKVDIANLSRLEHVPDEFIQISNKYLREHQQILNYGILSNAEINRIKNTLLLTH